MSENSDLRPLGPDQARKNFALEIEAYRAREREYHSQGVFLIDAEFPHA